MAKGNIMPIKQGVKIDMNTGLLVLSKTYAEKHLSASALKYAGREGKNYTYTWNRTSAIVAFELPRLLNIPFIEIMRYLLASCFDYVVENNLNDSQIHMQYTANCNKAV